MASREEKFKQAAWVYLGYGLLYMIGAVYLASQGIGARGMRVTPTVVWFILGTLFIVIFPLLLYRSWELHFVLRDSGRTICFFTRGIFGKVLTLAVAVRAFGVGRVMLAPTTPSVPLPWGGEAPMAVGAAIFFLITLATAAVLARAAWVPRSSGS